MRFFLFSLIIFIIAVINVVAVDIMPEKDLDLVIKQYREYLLKSNFTVEQKDQKIKIITDYIATMKDDGSWADVDYNSMQRSVWPTGNHLNRILQITLALKNGYFLDDKQVEVKGAIHKSFGYWIKNDFTCPNWWYNNIGGPQVITAITLLLGDELSPDELNYLTKTTLLRTKIAMTGQNRVWLAENTLVGALVTRDTKLVQDAVDVIFSEIIVTTKEGIQPDYSFHQHGAQIQFGNYGLAFANDIAKWSEILHGTTLDIPVEKLDIYRNYILEGQSWIIWRGKLDISSCGRQIFPGTQISKGSSALNIYSIMSKIDTENAKKYTAVVRRNKQDFVNDLVGNRYFWRSDYMVHRCPDFYASVKMCSNRVIGAESLNSENLSGIHLPDGATYIYRTGEEYIDIFPVWNWRQLPGVTCAQKNTPMPSFSNSKIVSKFVGGVTDGNDGCAVMDFIRDGVSAKKAWFFVKDQIVCLGAGIQSVDTETNPITTTVNQCLLNGPVKVSNGKEERTIDKGTVNAEDIILVEHDGIRYIFTQPQKIRLFTGIQTGNWKKIFDTVSTPKADISKNVFNMAIEHGTNPKDASYAYIIQPTEKARTQKAEVLKNTSQLQAVRFDTGLMQAVFYAPGELEYMPGKTISVNQPCMVMIDNVDKPEKIYVSDPTQILQAINITFIEKNYDVKLLVKGESGKTVVVEVK